MNQSIRIDASAEGAAERLADLVFALVKRGLGFSVVETDGDYLIKLNGSF
jgi:hypothetical protein